MKIGDLFISCNTTERSNKYIQKTISSLHDVSLLSNEVSISMHICNNLKFLIKPLSVISYQFTIYFTKTRLHEHQMGFTAVALCGTNVQVAKTRQVLKKKKIKIINKNQVCRYVCGFFFFFFSFLFFWK